jgi:pimeloyl-ACP methyl ester carboxylesterase
MSRAPDHRDPVLRLRAGRFDVDCFDVGSGPAVVLVHSSASGNRQWRRLADELKDCQRLIGVNLFGYGATTRWPAQRPQKLADQAALVIAAAAAVPGPVALVGHSMGAAVALEAAMQLGAHVRTVIAFEPILFYLLKMLGENDAFVEIKSIADGFRDCAAREEWAEAGRLFVDYWSGAGAWAAMSDERRAGLLALLPNVVHEWDCVLPKGRPLVEWGRIGAPAHLIRAADTRRPTREVATLLAQALGWTLHEVPAGGHMAPVTRPDLVNPLITRLLV